MTPSKNREDLKINYPSKRSSPGPRAKALAAARATGAKTFLWHCPKHGQALFSTSGACSCRQCIQDAQRKTRAQRQAKAIATALERELVANMAGHALLTQRTDDPVSVYLHAIAAKHAQRA